MAARGKCSSRLTSSVRPACQRSTPPSVPSHTAPSGPRTMLCTDSPTEPRARMRSCASRWIQSPSCVLSRCSPASSSSSGPLRLPNCSGASTTCHDPSGVSRRSTLVPEPSHRRPLESSSSALGQCSSPSRRGGCSGRNSRVPGSTCVSPRHSFATHAPPAPSGTSAETAPSRRSAGSVSMRPGRSRTRPAAVVPIHRLPSGSRASERTSSPCGSASPLVLTQVRSVGFAS